MREVWHPHNRLKQEGPAKLISSFKQSGSGSTGGRERRRGVVASKRSRIKVRTKGAVNATLLNVKVTKEVKCVFGLVLFIPIACVV